MRSFQLLFFCLVTSFVPAWNLPAKAQITPDDTLGAQSSTVTSDVVNGVPADLIEGGATSGGNLFHSFLDFNIDAGDRLYFNSPASIETILSRVTGNGPSSINGLLGTVGDSDAALILMNPNGIVFGENAVLDTQGAFTATTATSVQLGDDGSFSVINPESDSLLSINPSAFFFSGQAAQSQILVESQQNLSVLEGESLSLLGGDVVVDGGRIFSPGSQVDIVAVGEAGAIDANSHSVLSPESDGGSIRVENNAVVSVASATGGNVNFAAEDIQITSGGVLIAGIQAGLGTPNSQAGSLTLEGARIQISGQGTILGNTVGTGAVGQGGDIVLSAKDITVEDGPIIGTITFGSGDAGDIFISATDTVELGEPSTARVGILTSVSESAKGQGGNIEVSAANFELTGKTVLSTATFGNGDAGDITINAAQMARFDGSSGFSSVGSFSTEESSGQSGDIDISATNVDVLNGARISTVASGRERSGNTTVNASETLNIRGFSDTTSFASSVGSFSNSDSAGGSGVVEITANNLDVTEGGIIDSETIGNGNAGVVRLNVFETARFDGVRSIRGDVTTSGVRSTGGSGSGRGGRIELSARNLEITNGAQILAASVGEGDAGNIAVDVAEMIRIDGVDPVFNMFPSAISSDVLTGGTGQGGDVYVAATDLEVTNGAVIAASVSGQGDAGNVEIDVVETVRIDGVNLLREGQDISSISSGIAPGGEGQGGSVRVAANNLEVTNGGSISTSVGGVEGSPLSIGDAGKIEVVADTVLVDGVNLFTGTSASSIGSGIQESGRGQGGSVSIATTHLNVTNGGQINTSIFGVGDAGEVSITASETIRLSGYNRLIGGDDIFPSLLGSGIEEGGRGNGGNVAIAAKNLEVSDEATISAASIGEGSAGRIDLEIDERILVEEEGYIVTLSSSDSGGQITASANSLVLRDSGDISTSVRRGEGAGGNIILDVDYLIALDDSNISSASADGRGGNIDISSATLFSQTLNPIVENSNRGELAALEDNGRVDIDATGGVASGQISINDASFVEDDLANLPDVLVDTDALLANACVARSGGASGTLVLREGDRSSQSPGDVLSVPYSVGTVRPAPAVKSTGIQEPDELYQLADGRFVMSHRCQ